MPNQRIRGNQITDPRTITQNEHDERSDAKRVLIVDEDGNPINELNPLNTTAVLNGDVTIDGVYLKDKNSGADAEVDAQRRLRTHDEESAATLTEISGKLDNLDLRDLVPTQDGVHLGDSGTGITAEVDAQRRLQTHDSELQTEVQNIGTQLDDVINKLDNLDIRDLNPLQDGTHLGDAITGDTAQVDTQRRLRVLDADTKAVLDAIQASLNNPANLAQQSTLQAILLNLTDVLAALNTSVEIRSLNANRDDVMVAGSEDGTATGTIRHFVYNLRQQILASHDRQRNFTWSDFGTRTQRISQMDYASSTFPGVIARKSFNYTQIGNRYRLDSEVWSIII